MCTFRMSKIQNFNKLAFFTLSFSRLNEEKCDGIQMYFNF